VQFSNFLALVFALVLKILFLIFFVTYAK